MQIVRLRTLLTEPRLSKKEHKIQKGGGMKKFSFYVVLLFLGGCATYENYYKLADDYMQRREKQTKRFDVEDEKTILTASAQIFQDLGYLIDESEKTLGLISASKDREAGAGAIGTVGAVMTALLIGIYPPQDVRQKIFATLTISKDKISGYDVRVSFNRIIWNDCGGSRLEPIEDVKTYTDFFEKLDKSVFLTNNQL